MRKILLGNKNENLFALIDDEDFDKVNKIKWHLGKCGYVMGTERKTRKRFYLHRFILNPRKGLIIDHINNDSLDNRKENLRICTQSENLRNRSKMKRNKSGFKGVSWSKVRKKWIAQIALDNKSFNLGGFVNKKNAINAYKKAAIKFHGEYARF